MRYVLFTLSALFIFSSCTKTEDIVTREDTLRGSKWRLFSYNIRSIIPTAQIDTVSREDTVRGCREDDFLEFKENFNGLYYTGKNKCNSTEQDVSEFYWDLKEAGTRLDLYNVGGVFQTDAVNSEVLELTDDKMKLKYMQTVQNANNPGVVDTFIVTSSLIKI